MTIKEKIAYLSAIESILEDVEYRIKGAMVMRTNENDEWITDEHGNYVRFIPNEVHEPSSYLQYKALEKVRADIEKLADKV